MRALNIVGEPFTRLAGLSAPRRRRPPSSAGNASAGSDVVYHGRSLHRYGGSTRSRRESG